MIFPLRFLEELLLALLEKADVEKPPWVDAFCD
jgi:hypothetical protein